MWSWIYRIIAALLALIGSATLTFVGRALESEAYRVSLVLGRAALWLTAAAASAMLLASIVLLLSPASRRTRGDVA